MRGEGGEMRCEGGWLRSEGAGVRKVGWWRRVERFGCERGKGEGGELRSESGSVENISVPDPQHWLDVT